MSEGEHDLVCQCGLVISPANIYYTNRDNGVGQANAWCDTCKREYQISRRGHYTTVGEAKANLILYYNDSF